MLGCLALLAITIAGKVAARAAVRAIAFSPNSHQIAAVTESADLLLFDIARNRTHVDQRDLIVGNEPLACIAFSPDGKWLATGGGNHLLAVYATKPKLTKAWTIPAPQGDATGVAFTRDSATVGWTTAPTEHVYLFDISGQWKRTLFLIGNGMQTLAFLPDGKSLVTGGQALTVWDLTQPGEQIPDSEATGARQTFKDLMGWTTSLDVDRSGRKIVACGVVSPADKGEPRSVALIDSLTGQLVRTLARSDVVTNAVSVSRDGTYSAAADAEGGLRIWRNRTGQLLHQLRVSTRELRTVAISPDGRTVAASGDDGLVRLYDLASGRRLAEW